MAAVLWMLSWGLLAYNHLNITCSRRGMASVAGTALNHTNLTLRAHICAYIKHIPYIQASSLTLFLSVWRLCPTHLFPTLSSLFLSMPLMNNIYIYLKQAFIFLFSLSLSHTSIYIYILSISIRSISISPFHTRTHMHFLTSSLSLILTLFPSSTNSFPLPPYSISISSQPHLSVCLPLVLFYPRRISLALTHRLIFLPGLCRSSGSKSSQDPAASSVISTNCSTRRTTQHPQLLLSRQRETESFDYHARHEANSWLH